MRYIDPALLNTPKILVKIFPMKPWRESFNFKRKILSTLCPLGLSLQIGFRIRKNGVYDKFVI